MTQKRKNDKKKSQKVTKNDQNRFRACARGAYRHLEKFSKFSKKFSKKAPSTPKVTFYSDVSHPKKGGRTPSQKRHAQETPLPHKTFHPWCIYLET